MARGPATCFFQIVEPLLLELEVGIRLLGAHFQACNLDRQFLVPCFLADHLTACFGNALLLARDFINGLL